MAAYDPNRFFTTKITKITKNALCALGVLCGESIRPRISA